MNDKKIKSSIKLHPGKRKTHGGYAFLTRGTLPENRAYIERYLTAARVGLIRDLGPLEEDLSTAQIIIIDRVVSKLGCVRCIEEHIRENSVIRGHDLAPSLKASYLAYGNSIRLDLQALGIEKRKADEALDLGKYIEEKDSKRGEDSGKS